MADILVADDTRAIRRALVILLEEAGHSVRLATDGEEALAEWRRKRPDMILLDVMMPKRNGYQVLAQIRRADPALPIIFLSAKGSPADIALGLDLGSDDYLPKPFDRDVLLSRINAVFRRSQISAAPSSPSPPPAARAFEIGRHRVDERRYALVGADGHEEALSARELELLRWFAAHPNEVATRETLLSEIWGYSYTGTTRTLDQHILMLRKKLGDDADCIRTVHRAGYRYVPKEGAAATAHAR